MVEPDVAALNKQRLRLRDLAKYYEAVLPHDYGRQGINGPLLATPTHEFKPSLPRLAADPQLTALAQLAAFRTGCQRSYISIVDHEAQHVIAEATRSISVFDRNLRQVGDDILIGAQSLPLSWGPCPVTLGVFSGEPGPFLDEPTNYANKDFVIVADLRSEGKTKHLPAISHLPPILRYYVQVPLRSESGSVLGSLCTIHSSPQQPEPTHALALQDVASLVVQHLENLRMKEDHRRAELLLSGLAHFIRGQDSMSAWSETTPGQELIPSVQSQRARLSTCSLASLPMSTADRQSADVATAHDATNTCTSSATRTTTTTTTTTTTVSSDAEDEVAKVSSVSSLGDEIDVGFDPFPANEQIAASPAQFLAENSINVRHTFSRASNLIREAMDLDATIFLEVPHNDRFKNPKTRRRKGEASSARSGHQPCTPTSDSGSWTDSSDASLLTDGSIADEDLDANVLCHRLGYATKLKSSLANSIVTKPFLTIPVTLLSRLARRYPQGHIFHFDSYGSVSSGDDDETATIEQRKIPLPQGKLSSRLHRMFPDARSLIFLPLYDNDKQQIYAGFIGMSVCPTRALQKYESVYVSAFVNSLMCEVMRLEAMKTDKAKSDFISSISHELRSPLHGILASSQLLAESNIRPAQVEFVQMVDTCARTLLDTMDHLLDHAKINHFTRQQTQRRKSLDGKRGSPSRPYSLVTSTNMLSVVEETVASMAASSNQMLQNVGGTRSLSGPDHCLTVPVMLDILPNEFWKFDTEAGSWRRLIMNLVGNSLKYTQQGHVRVSFGLRKQSDTKFLAELDVVDTGQGISEEYLKHRLYTPFSQENNLSVGTGLGLSLVHQIVSSLRGDIRIYSEVGSGTRVSIKVPLSVSKSDEAPQPEESGDTDLIAAMKQQTISFSGFDEGPSLSEAPTGIYSPHMKTLSAVKSSMSDLLSQWFKSRLVTKSASIVVVEESFLENNLTDLDRPGQRLLIVGLKGRRGTIADQIKQAAYIYLLPPIGPTRMALALKSLLQARDTSSSSVSDVSLRPKLNKILSSSSSTDFGVPSPPMSGSHEFKEAILLVDDNEINLRILVTCIGRLELNGVDILTACNGKEAVERYTTAIESGVSISVVFMDISMPVMDGFQATRQIRSLEKDRGISKTDGAKIMALTGLASAEALNEVKASGFDSYLRKPVNLRTIREVLAAARI